jgi:hypothetical protein
MRQEVRPSIHCHKPISRTRRTPPSGRSPRPAAFTPPSS